MSLFAALPEDFLHFVWKTLNFRLKDLRTSQGDLIQLIRPGIHNQDQGPDFLQASLRIGQVIWHGQVEIHVKAEDWYRHGHHLDPQYNATILHVVLQAGKRPAMRQDGTIIPECVLEPHIPSEVIHTYSQIRLSESRIPCAALLPTVPRFFRQQWVDRLTIERMETKAMQFQQEFLADGADWEEGLWQGLACYMAGPANQHAFLQMAQIIPYSIIRHYQHHLPFLESLLFGGIGCLETKSSTDSYYQQLASEWAFLQQKHSLDGPQSVLLKFGRMRPASFPTIRLAQLAQLLHQHRPLIKLLSKEGMTHFLQKDITVSDYWRSHYRFFESSVRRKKSLGTSQKEILVSNVMIPAAFVYQRAHGREDLYELIETGLQQLAAENNRLTRPLEKLGFRNENAFHSQGLIQLHKHYCSPKRCLSCHLGQRMMKKKDE
ncbi:MAG: DUF2851 family protein [Bacteroidota bacterium]